MEPVTYGVAVSARRTYGGWDLTLSNGDALFVPALDNAAERVRDHLDLQQPAVNHRFVAVVLTVEPAPAPEPATPSVPDPAVDDTWRPHSLHTPDPAPEPEPDPPPPWTPEPGPAWTRAPETTPASPPTTFAEVTPELTPEPVRAASTTDATEDVDGMSLTLRFLAARGTSTDFAGAASQVLPWVDDLPTTARRQCLSDLWVALKDANESFRYSPLEDAVRRWRPHTTGATATAASATTTAAPTTTAPPEPPASPASTYTAPDPEPVDLLPRVSLPPEPAPEPHWTPDSTWSPSPEPVPAHTADPHPSSPGFLTGFPGPSSVPPDRPARPARPARHEGSGRHRL